MAKPKDYTKLLQLNAEGSNYRAHPFELKTAIRGEDLQDTLKISCQKEGEEENNATSTLTVGK